MSFGPDGRFVTVAVLSMAVFLMLSATIARVDQGSGSASPWLWLASGISIAALLAPLWALWRYLWELDEYLRSIQFNAIFFGLAVLLVLVTGWGYAELFADAPPLAIFWLNPAFWLAYSLAVVAQSVSERLRG